VQRAAHTLRSLTGLLGVAYLTLHLAVTGGVLLWLPQLRPAAFPFVCTPPLLASALSLVGFLVYPTAPPRLAGIGIVDTVSNGHEPVSVPVRCVPDDEAARARRGRTRPRLLRFEASAARTDGSGAGRRSVRRWRLPRWWSCGVAEVVGCGPSREGCQSPAELLDRA
jgi:PAP2 superfamily protein